MTVVVVGSSGGGTATLGHTNVQDLLTTIHMELQKIDNPNEQQLQKHGISLALFVSCDVSMDSVNPETDMATLWTVGIQHHNNNSNNNSSSSISKQATTAATTTTLPVERYFSGRLKDVNEVAKKLADQHISPVMMMTKTTMTKIQGLIGISCDPLDINHSILAAAAKANIPMTGSGGTSLSAAMSHHPGLRLVGNAGGSVATTTYTRAVSYCFALSQAWNHPYSYTTTNHNITTKPTLKSILDACLPSFLAVCVTCRFLDLLPDNYYYYSSKQQQEWIDLLRFQALPSVCAVVAATSLAPEHGSTAIMASVVSSMACHGSILSGLLAGWLVSHLLGRVLFFCIRVGVPATMTNILVAGFVGSSLAVSLSISGIVDILLLCTNWIRELVQTTNLFGGYGFVLGCIFCYGSKVGWYHSIFLPIILIEMEQGNPSMWGSVDQCVLVMVSAGICASNVLIHNSSSNGGDDDNDYYLSRRGLKINLLCGDFIEVAYPYMEQSNIVNIFAYLASGISTEILYQSSSSSHSVLSSAYLPLPISIILAKDPYRISLAMLSAFTISFSGMSLSKINYRTKEE